MIRTSRSVALVITSLCWLLSLRAQAQRPELVVQTGHAAAISSVAFSQDGKLIATGSGAHTITIWEVASGSELRVLQGDSLGVLSVAFSPDGKTLASGGIDKTIKLWDVQSGTQLRVLTGHSGGVWSVVFSRDGKTLVSGGDNTIRLWNVDRGSELQELKAHGGIRSVALSPDEKTLASGDEIWPERFITLWDIASGRELRTLKGHSGVVESVAFSPDGKTLASADNDQTIKLWDVATGSEVRALRGHSSVVFTPDGKMLAGCDGNKIKFWDVITGSEVRVFTEPLGPVTLVATTPDGKMLASLGRVGIKLWDVSSGREQHALKRRSFEVASVAFSPEGKTLASGCADHTIRLWDLAGGTPVRTLTGHTDQVVSLAFSPDGKLLASGSWDQTIKLWDVASGELRNTMRHYGPIHSVTFSPDGKMLASGSYLEPTETGPVKDDTIRLWEVATGRELWGVPGHSYGVYSVAFSPDGKTLASGGDDRYDRTLKLWDVASGRELRAWGGHSAAVKSVAFSPDGKTLASGDDLRTIKLWDMASGSELRTLAGHSSSVTSITFSPDGKTLVSSSVDSMLKLWTIDSGSELRELKGHSNAVRSVAFSPDGKTLISASADASVKVWEISSGKELVSLIALDANDWIVTDPFGRFDGSPTAWKQILWRFNNNTFDRAPVEAFFSDFYYPGLLNDSFAGKAPKAPSDISQKDRRQPRVELAAPDVKPGAKLTARNATVKIHVSEVSAEQQHKVGSGGQDVRLFRNGSLVKVWRGDVLNGQSSVTLETTVPIIAGENKFTAYAFNHDNIKSSDAELVVTGADSLKRQGTAYVLAIGVNSYANSRYNLKYAVADAEDFASEVKRQQESLKRYAKVEVISLANAQARKANITQSLVELAKQVQPEDAVIVFFAGHGTAQGNQFYLIPHDLGYDGPRESLSKAGLRAILDHSISDRELEKLFEGIDAAQLLLVIDACNSGQALEAEEKRRGPMNSKGLAQLAYEKGMYVLTAAQSYQAAQEAAKFGHGFLTYALVEEGLKQGAADREPKNGSIDIREWLNFATDEVPRMQEENSTDALRGRGRYVVFVGDGRDVGIPKTDAGTRDNIQRPRVFYRRELESHPLVVAVLGTTKPQ